MQSRLRRTALAVAAAVGLAGCCQDPWEAFPEKNPPDRQCVTGGSAAGFDVYVWECLRGQRVVLAQYSAELSCRKPERATAACGGETTLDKAIKIEPADCAGPRPGRAWR